MEITLEQAYDAALTTIGRLTIEQNFMRLTIESQAAELQELRDSSGADTD